MIKKNQKHIKYILCAIFFVSMFLIACGGTGLTGRNRTVAQKTGYASKIQNNSFQDRDKTEPRNYDHRLFVADMNYYTELDMKVCEQIVAFAERVAAGEQEETVMQLDVEKLLGKTCFTAEELKVKKVTQYNMSAIAQKILDYKISNFMDAMLYEHPYEFFWFDKLIGTYTDGWRVYTEDNKLFFPEYLTVHMAVTRDYVGSEQYTVVIDKIKAAQKAKDYALSLIEEAKDLSDYDKLLFYRDKICEMTEYFSKEERKKTADGIYDNHWQMINVFDQDPSTKVQCEGYVKAFQFLCDNTEFDGNIWCFSVRCKKNDGNHVINILHMDDGKFYLADITASDKLSRGSEKLCFLEGVVQKSVEDGFLYHERVIDTDQGPYTVKSAYYTYRDVTLELWDWEMLTLADNDYK